MSIYALKPKFQNLLRPLTRALFNAGVTANQVTLAACVISVALGLWLFIDPRPALFGLIPLWMFLRMAFNAIDGMLAREFGQKSKLGAYLNELTDVISDACLYLPFAALLHFPALWVGVFIALSIVVEMSGVIGLMVDASRRYDGPFGKSDRAFVIGALALAIWLGLPVQGWQALVFPLMSLLCALTIVQRVRKGLAEAAAE
ncbi:MULTISPECIES: CDP-alcohol phosphatidyltransferase family protein [unclassified Uliginosibacterium]|uniref:CDP-alcohol phosphatidyltransferase family protein n=1 Tax=unclassified Uliginosibacterium TaxID=2621521 RepID=UPI000C7CA1C6|nr:MULTISPECIES: CDP-alcohol phosphatidyltransferase family protein [unclassified Uliginosibacterium]MDO6386877.1 CDP-alcohol phosphatidyltransferase family protein [Uliginosibacterium sp. 31-12]PLK49569.1 CDP-alcohol phosphatidyltransferase [Uliginosibacterium sp. TH139]